MNPGLDHADYTAPPRPRYLELQIRNLSALKDLDRELGLDHTDHTDHLSEACNVFFPETYLLKPLSKHTLITSKLARRRACASTRITSNSLSDCVNFRACLPLFFSLESRLSNAFNGASTGAGTDPFT